MSFLNMLLYCFDMRYINWAHYKQFISMMIDIVVAFALYIVALNIRFGTAWFLEHLNTHLLLALCFSCAACAANIILSIYKDVWRHFSLRYFIRYAKYSSVTSVIFVMILYVSSLLDYLPYSVLFMSWLLQIIITSYARITYQYIFLLSKNGFKEFWRKKEIADNNAVIIGSSYRVGKFLIENSLSATSSYKVIGIVDINNQDIGRRISDVPIIGGADNLEDVIQGLIKIHGKISKIILDDDTKVIDILSKISTIAQKFLIPVAVFAYNINDLSNHKKYALRPIEIEDLLFRKQRDVDVDKITSFIEGRTILITGAGGSIGSEIAMQCCQHGAGTIILMDSSEYLLYEIDQLCKRKYPNVLCIPKLVDIRDNDDSEKLFATYAPDTLFHAAALKHVPLMQEHKMQALSVNFYGTCNMIALSKKYKVKNFIFISTDKAVSPLSFMGMTKRLAELMCFKMADEIMPIHIVRFGNVLGSNGSVVPLFKKQIEAGGPVTVTHPDATRYFMTISEAVNLVLEASMIKMQSACSTYILDMGDPIKVLDLAEKMISLSGLRPYVDVAIEFIGLRPGEKIHEVLYNEHSALDETCHKSIFYVQDNAIDKKLTTDEKFALELHTKSPTDLSDALDMLYIAVKQKDEQKALQYVDKILGIAKAL